MPFYKVLSGTWVPHTLFVTELWEGKDGGRAIVENLVSARIKCVSWSSYWVGMLPPFIVSKALLFCSKVSMVWSLFQWLTEWLLTALQWFPSTPNCHWNITEMCGQAFVEIKWPFLTKHSNVLRSGTKGWACHLESLLLVQVANLRSSSALILFPWVLSCPTSRARLQGTTKPKVQFPLSNLL